uniref:Uncharacterized protein n=1 Tax=Arundo donax TaxID=35708 RepID=A0A0A9HMN7_ARUDO
MAMNMWSSLSFALSDSFSCLPFHSLMKMLYAIPNPQVLHRIVRQCSLILIFHVLVLRNINPLDLRALRLEQGQATSKLHRQSELLSSRLSSICGHRVSCGRAPQ